jgi:predicted nucleic acid-binding protein
MILVDSSVWIDWLRGYGSAEADRLDALIGEADILVGDLILTEVLRGITSDFAYERTRTALSNFPVMRIVTPEIADVAARHYRELRRRGITVRNTIDSLIASHCIAGGIALLHRDRDFDPYVSHFGLRLA